MTTSWSLVGGVVVSVDTEKPHKEMLLLLP